MKSLAAPSDCRDDCFRMGGLTFQELRLLGFEVRVIENPLKTQTLPDDSKLPLPTIILATYNYKPGRKAVMRLHQH